MRPTDLSRFDGFGFLDRLDERDLVLVFRSSVRLNYWLSVLRLTKSHELSDQVFFLISNR